MSFPTFDRAAAVVDQFLELLEARGITFAKGGQAEDQALAMADVLEMWKNPAIRPADPRSVGRAAMGFIDVAGKVVGVKDHKDFSQLLPHLEMLSKTTVLQNAKALVTDDAANKVIELYVAALAMSFGSNVALDHPVNSIGDNPDVMLDFRGERWALALKTLHGTKPQTMFDNIKKASDQIEASKADHGLVIINVKNVLDHDALWPSPQASFAADTAIAMLQAQMEGIKGCLKDFPQEEWLEVFNPTRKALPPVVFLGQGAFSVFPPQSLQPHFMSVKAMALFLVECDDEHGAMKLVKALHHTSQQFI